MIQDPVQARLDEIRKREEAVTPEPWGWDFTGQISSFVWDVTTGLYEPEGRIVTADDNGLVLVLQPHAEFIAHARSDVPWLCEQVERLQEDIGKLVTKFGGPNAGHLYGAANCRACGILTNDYYLVGQSQLCLDCHAQFPKLADERDQLRTQVKHLASEVHQMSKREEELILELGKLRAENELLKAVAEAAAAINETAECREDEDCDHCVLSQALAALDAHRAEGGK